MSQVNQESRKPAVKFFQCRQAEFLVQMNQLNLSVGRRNKRVAGNEAADRARFVPGEVRKLAGIDGTACEGNSQFAVGVLAQGRYVPLQCRPKHPGKQRLVFSRRT